MTVSTSTLFCIVCGREFRPRDADTVICPDCGGPPEAPAPSQPQGTALADQPRGTVLMSQPAYQRMCILCGQDFTTPDPQADRCPQCRGEAPHPQPEIRSRPESRQSTPAMPAPAQGTVAMPESGLSPAPSSADVPLEWNAGDVILGEYRVEKELGEGGFGKVYLVRSERTDAVFAVKKAILTTEQTRRDFIAELRVWVDLPEYPHIVPLRFFRTLGHEILLFTDYIPGGSLNKWIEERKLYMGEAQQALSRMMDIAIQFAWGLHFLHHLGYVHEDVKPHNVLLTPDGIARVSDFGLVRPRALQREGKRPTTPQYHSPEQSLGQMLSHKTDIWSYGVSLLHMFSGEVSWLDGTIAEEILERYLEQPSTKDLPRMPPEVADILRRCLQQNPTERWESMLDVANALQQVYANLFGPYPRTMPLLPERKEADLFRQSEGAAWLDPLPYLQQALSSIGRDPREAERFAADRKTSPSAQAVADLACYEEVLRIYGEYSLASPGLPELGKLYGNKAILQQYLNDLSGALLSFDRAIQIWEKLVLEQGQWEYANSLAVTYHNKAFHLHRLHKYDEALQNYERALEILERTVLKEERLDGLLTLIAAYNNKALALSEIERHNEALHFYDRAILLLEDLSRKTAHPQAINRLAVTLSNKAKSLVTLQRFDQALQLCDRAIALQEDLVLGSGREEFSEDLVTSYANKSGALAHSGKDKESLQWLEKAIEIYERLVFQCQRHDLQDALARLYSNKADILERCGRFEESIQFHDKAIDLHKQNVIQAGKWELAEELALAYRGKADTFIKMRQYQMALQTCDQSLAILERLVFQENHSELLEELAATYAQKSRLFGFFNLDEALSMQEKAVACFERAVKQEGRQDLVHLLTLAKAYEDQAALLSRMHRYDRCLTCYDQAIEIYTSMNKEQEEVAEANARTHLGKGLALNECGRYDEAILCCDTASQVFQALYQRGQARFALFVAKSQNAKGNALVAQGSYAEAMHAFDQAIQMLESLASQEQTISDELAHACNNKGFVLDELHQYSKALAFYDKAIEIWQRLIDQEQMTENIPHLLAACNNKAFALLNLNRSDEAIRWCDKAIGIGKQNWTLPPDGMALLSKELSVSHHRKATILGRQGNYEQAIGEYAEGIRHLEHLVLGGQWEFCFGLANMMANQGYCLLRVGKRTESQRVLRNTLQVIDKGLRNTNDARLLALRHQVQSMF